MFKKILTLAIAMMVCGNASASFMDKVHAAKDVLMFRDGKLKAAGAWLGVATVIGAYPGYKMYKNRTAKVAQPVENQDNSADNE